MADFRTISQTGTQSGVIDQGLQAHMNKVYGTMSVGLLVTAAVAWGIGNNDALLSMLRDPFTLRPNGLGWVVMFAPLAMVFLFGGMINRISAAAAQMFFYVFAAVFGASISWIFAAFTDISIAQTFVAVSAGFAGLSLWGYTTKRDISGWGSFLIMGVIGLLVAMLLNMFVFQSVNMHFAISAIGVLIFAALTAYDTQQIKVQYLQHAHAADSEWLGKAAIMGALQLYLDFVNMFMFLLQFMGNRE